MHKYPLKEKSTIKRIIFMLQEPRCGAFPKRAKYNSEKTNCNTRAKIIGGRNFFFVDPFFTN